MHPMHVIPPLVQEDVIYSMLKKKKKKKKVKAAQGTCMGPTNS